MALRPATHAGEANFGLAGWQEVRGCFCLCQGAEQLSEPRGPGQPRDSKVMLSPMGWHTPCQWCWKVPHGCGRSCCHWLCDMEPIQHSAMLQSCQHLETRPEVGAASMASGPPYPCWHPAYVAAPSHPLPSHALNITLF